VDGFATPRSSAYSLTLAEADKPSNEARFRSRFMCSLAATVGIDAQRAMKVSTYVFPFVIAACDTGGKSPKPLPENPRSNSSLVEPAKRSAKVPDEPIVGFTIMKREIWGESREKTLQLDVLVSTDKPSIAALQRVARDAGESAYHVQIANSKSPVCNVMVRLHNKESTSPQDEIAAYGTAQPVHAALSCLDEVPELWTWEYHIFPKR
jgi:hypothetical protein